MLLERMDPEELLEEFWKPSKPEQEKRETKYPRKLSPREMRLRTAIVLSVLLLAGAACGTIAWVGALCMDHFDHRACEFEMFMRDRWCLLPAWGIAGVLVILLLMWGTGWVQRLREWWGRRGRWQKSSN